MAPRRGDLTRKPASREKVPRMGGWEQSLSDVVVATAAVVKLGKGTKYLLQD